MKSLQTLFRLIRINTILMKYSLLEILFSVPALRPFRVISYLSPFYWLRNRNLPRGERLRLALENLGPIYVKFGQIISTRRDLIPEDIANELACLQDNVPPFDSKKAKKLIEASLKTKIDDLFKHFEDKPLASASIAQVHAATLHGGQDVVVKVLRPNIEILIERDIAVLYTIAGLFEKYSAHAKKFKPVAMVKEFETALQDEQDLMREAANASQLRRNFAASTLLHIPEVYWKYSAKEVMVMERIYGTPVSNLKALKEQKVNLKVLAERGIEIFFTQVFRDCFFHADMHPGNIFIDTTYPDEPKYIAVDFGIMGTLNPHDQQYLAENLLAFFNRDYKRVAELHVDSGWVSRETRVEAFESAIRTVCEPIFERPLKDISFGQLLLQLFQTAQRFEMNIQPQLIMLQKTLLNIEGLGRQLYPELNLWESAKPFLEQWMQQRIGTKAIIRELRKQAPHWLHKLPELPEATWNFLTAHKSQQKEIYPEQFTKQQLNQLSNAERRTNWTIIATGCMLGTLFTIALPKHMGPVYGAYPIISYLLATTGLLSIVKAWRPSKV